MTQRLDDIELVSRLVAFDTTSHNSNLDLVSFVADYLDRPGVRIHHNPSAAGDKANLLVEIGARATRAGLSLSGHTDVVPAEEPEWESEPFTLTAKGDRLYGRGACDMKAFVALAVNTCAALDPDALTHPVALILTYDEEVGLLGAKRLCETWPELDRLPGATWIGEPTGLEVVHAHKGFADLRLEVEGVSAHSGYPHLGRSAIEPAGRAIVALAELRAQLERERPPNADAFPDVPFVTLNIGHVSGGTAVNVIPDRCRLRLSVRPLPGMELGELVERIRHAVERAVGDAPFALETVAASPAMLADRDAPLARVLMAEVGQVNPNTVSYATDAGWLQHAGLACVVFGPGDIAVAHKPNEYILVPELRRAREIMDRVVRKFCY